MTDTHVELDDGRVLWVHEFGDPTGRPVVFCHGGGRGASGLFAWSCDEIAKDLGLRILAPDRPGVGRSSPQPRRTLLDWPKDVAQMADALRLDTFSIASYSGGSGYALACAWQMAERVTSVSTISTVPSLSLVRSDERVPFKAKLAMRCSAATPACLTRLVFSRIAHQLEHEPAKAFRSFLRRLPECERRAVDCDANRDLLRSCAISTFRQGPGGAVEDLRLIFADWKFPLAEVRQPVILWHGEQDTTAPPQMASAVQQALPHAELHLVPQAGHLSTWLTRAREVLAAT